VALGAALVAGAAIAHHDARAALEILAVGSAIVGASTLRRPWNQRAALGAPVLYLLAEIVAARIDDTSYLELLATVVAVLLAGLAAAAYGDDVERRAKAAADAAAAHALEVERRDVVVHLQGGSERTPLREAIERAARTSSTVAVLAIAPDGVVTNPIEDRKRVADVIGTLGRNADAPFVTPDGSIIVVLPDAERREARMAAERLRLGVASEASDGFSVSVGVAVYPPDGRGEEELLAAAAAAAGRGRALGGNRTVLTSIGPDDPPHWAGGRPGAR
jgi:hypothetical protein